jgi:DNA mismatch repair protein MutS
VLRAARKYLVQLENEGAAAAPQLDLFSAATRAEIPDTEPHAVLAALKEVEPDSLTPRAALELVYRLRRLAE